MPLKTKPTTRMERRLMKEVSELKSQMRTIQSVNSDLLATQRNHNQETTTLRQRIRQLEAVPTQEPKGPVTGASEAEIEMRINRAVQCARDNDFLKRIMEATSQTLFMASKQEFQTADQIRANAKKTEVITPSSAEIIEAVGKTLYDLAVVYGRHENPIEDY